MTSPLAAAEILTPRLRLRQFEPRDLEEYAALCADPEVMRFLSTDGTVLSRVEAWRQMAMFLGHWQLRGFGVWAAESRETGRLIGRIGLHQPEGWPGREVGWALARDCWGQGLALEGASAAVRHAFAALGWDHVISLIRPGNTRSVRLAERLGAVAAGTADLRGEPHLVYRLDAVMWKSSDHPPPEARPTTTR